MLRKASFHVKRWWCCAAGKSAPRPVGIGYAFRLGLSILSGMVAGAWPPSPLMHGSAPAHRHQKTKRQRGAAPQAHRAEINARPGHDADVLQPLKYHEMKNVQPTIMPR